MIKELKSGLQRRKVKIFLTFLICSFIIWLISRLSETYTNTAEFQLEFANVPDSLMLTDASKDKIDVRLEASGFQFLGFNFNQKRVVIDLSSVDQYDSSYFVTQQIFRRQIERQISGSMKLLEVDRDTLFFNFQQLFRKDLPVNPNITINLGPNHLLEGQLIIEPEIVTVSGPKEEIAQISELTTLEMILSDLTEDFESRATLYKPEELKNTTFSANSVKVSGKVFRFSEKIIELPVEVTNLPEGVEIKTFPNAVSILCKARIERLKDLGPADFKLVADYAKVGPGAQYLIVQLEEKPEEVYSAQLLVNQVEFILKRE